MSNTILFGLLFTFIMFLLGRKLSEFLKVSILNPFLISVVLSIVVLKVINVSYEDYMAGGQFIHFMLGPVTVALAVPLYRQFDLIKKYFILFVLGSLTGIIVSFGLVAFSVIVFDVVDPLYISAFPKSITGPMAFELSKILGGEGNLTMMFVTFTGVTGAAFGKIVIKITRSKNPLAIGLALGTISHAIGTSLALELGEEEGAVSSAAIGMTGVLTVVILPILLNLTNLI